MTKTKKYVLCIVAFLLSIIILLFLISPPWFTIFRLNHFQPYDVLLKQEEPTLFDSIIYVTETDGNLSSAIFWRDGIRWRYLADLQGNPNLTLIGGGFPTIENGKPDIIHYCLIAGTEDSFRQQIVAYSPATDLTYEDLQTTIIESTQGELLAAWCTSRDDSFSSRDLAWLVLN